MTSSVQRSFWYRPTRRRYALPPPPAGLAAQAREERVLPAARLPLAPRLAVPLAA